LIDLLRWTDIRRKLELREWGSRFDEVGGVFIGQHFAWLEGAWNLGNGGAIHVGDYGRSGYRAKLEFERKLAYELSGHFQGLLGKRNEV